jgi:hypothetical protein
VRGRGMRMDVRSLNAVGSIYRGVDGARDWVNVREPGGANGSISWGWRTAGSLPFFLLDGNGGFTILDSCNHLKKVGTDVTIFTSMGQKLFGGRDRVLLQGGINRLVSR